MSSTDPAAATTPTTTTTTSDKVQILEEPKIPVISFCVRMPPQDLFMADPLTEREDARPPPPPKMINPMLDLLDGNAIVGSIVKMQNSAMIWVGWGTLDVMASQAKIEDDDKNDPPKPSSSSSSLGTGIPPMGPLVVAMPRTQYKGAFKNSANEASCSQIIGSENSEDQMLASQMASRLSTRLGMAIFVSCQLMSGGKSNNNNNGGDGPGGDMMDSEIMSHRAAALAEKEIARLLQQPQQQQQQPVPNATNA